MYNFRVTIYKVRYIGPTIQSIYKMVSAIVFFLWFHGVLP